MIVWCLLFLVIQHTFQFVEEKTEKASCPSKRTVVATSYWISEFDCCTSQSFATATSCASFFRPNSSSTASRNYSNHAEARPLALRFLSQGQQRQRCRLPALLAQLGCSCGLVLRATNSEVSAQRTSCGFSCMDLAMASAEAAGRPQKSTWSQRLQEEKSQRGKGSKGSREAEGKGQSYCPNSFCWYDRLCKFHSNTFYKSLCSIIYSKCATSLDSRREAVDKQGEAVQLDLAAAVRNSYPDISKAPPEIRVELEKYEKMEKHRSKQHPPTLAGQISAATLEMEQAEEALHSLRARDSHRAEWMGHLEESLKAWKEHLAGYQKQEDQFASMIAAAKGKFQVASATIQRLNETAHASAPPNAPNQVISDDEEEKIRHETWIQNRKEAPHVPRGQEKPSRMLGQMQMVVRDLG